MSSRPSVMGGGSPDAAESGVIRRGPVAYAAPLATMGGPSSDAPGSWASRPLWDPASGKFDPARLRAAILARGWTVAEFAVTYGGGRSTFYTVMHGVAPSDRTVLLVNETLASREPVAFVDA